MSEKVYTLEEVKKHCTDKDCWLVVYGKVYDVTAFLEEHPGGYDIIVQSTGKDATQDFDEIGHSNSAKELLEKYLIGKFEGGDAEPAQKAGKTAASAAKAPSSFARTLNVLLPVLLLAAAVAINVYINKTKATTA